MKDIIPEGMGERIGIMRRSRKMTQEVLSEMLDVSSKHISHVERGDASLSLGKILQVSEIFDCSLDYLIKGKEHDPAFSVFPETVVNVVHSDNKKDIDRLIRYLDIYSELFDQTKVW